MDKNYEYDEAEYEEGITFKKVGYFFKKGWLRMVIYVAVCILLATAVALPIRVFYKSEPVAQTTIEYVYEGIEEGKAPDGSVLKPDNIISVTVLADAVKDAGLGEVVSDISTLRQSMRVEGVQTDEYVALVQAAADGNTEAANTLRNYVMYPTSFDIIISDPEKLGLSDSDAQKLLNNVVQRYYDDFIKRFSVQKLFAEDIFTFSKDQAMEFAGIFDVYNSVLKSTQDSLSELAAKNPDYTSLVYNSSFANLVRDFATLQNKLDQFNAYITSNNIWLDKTAARNELLASRTDINNNLEPLQAYIVELNKQIAMIQPNTTTSGTESDKTVTVSYPREYFEYHAKLDEANREVRDYNARLASIATRLEKLEETEATSSALINEAKSRLRAIENEAKEKTVLANDVIRDFYQTQFISQSVRQIRPAIVTRRGQTFSMLIVLGAAALVGLLAACLVTAIKISVANGMRNKAEQAKAKAQAQAEEKADFAEDKANEPAKK